MLFTVTAHGDKTQDNVSSEHGAIKLLRKHGKNRQMSTAQEGSLTKRVVSVRVRAEQPLIAHGDASLQHHACYHSTDALDLPGVKCMTERLPVRKRRNDKIKGRTRSSTGSPINAYREIIVDRELARLSGEGERSRERH